MKPPQEQQEFWQNVAGASPFNNSAVSHLRISDMDEIRQEDGQGRKTLDGFQMTWEGIIPKEWDNGNDTMHGAAAAWIVDVCTSAAIMVHTSETFWGAPLWAGVSLAINMTYLHPAYVGTDISVQVKVLKCSSTSANLECNIIEKKTGKLLCSGTHLKAWRPKRQARL